jgi:hypothetical protein
MKALHVSQMGGLTGQSYYLCGAYDLNDDEALVVAAKVPQKCQYSSMILTNNINETTDLYNNHSSLNGSQYHVDKDGMLRVVVSAKDPRRTPPAIRPVRYKSAGPIAMRSQFHPCLKLL